MTETTETAAEADADTVVNRAAQVISSMGAEIRALTHQRDRYRSAWCSARERAQAYGEGILRVVKDREAYQEWLRQAEARTAVVSPPAADQADLRAAVVAAIKRAPFRELSNDGVPNGPLLITAFVDDLARWILPVLPDPATTRAAALRSAADAYDALIDKATGKEADPRYWQGVHDVAVGLRAMADEAQQPETRRCVCPHPADEHSIYGCADGCPCEWMPKRRATRPRCPHCRMPHDLDPASGIPAICASIRASLQADEPAAEAEDVERCVRCGHTPAAHNISGCLECPGGWPADHQYAPAAVSGAAATPDTEAEPVVTVHAIPLPGSNGISSCCGRPPCEFVGERLTRDPSDVTCPGLAS
ncbi:hypothetical protein [Streptomyces sp. NPDC096324]|uniref:hypothetical protein n=1 Tax=Streptomyces sp. NPDC096324 TaxID=3366085 RepID=UPI0037FD7354